MIGDLHAAGSSRRLVIWKAERHDRRVHELRHTFASLLLQAGAPITYVSQQLGHADASITLQGIAVKR